MTKSSFKGQLLLALALNVGLKLFTFSLSTLLTRLLLPYQNGVYFTFSVYNDAVLFIAREATRNVASRLPILDAHAVAPDGNAGTEKTAGATRAGDGADSRSTSSGGAGVVRVRNVRTLVHIALLSVPLAAAAAAAVEVLGGCFGAASFFPSMLRHARASQAAVHKAENATSAVLGAGAGAQAAYLAPPSSPLPSLLAALPMLLLPYMPELTVVLCTVLMAAVEPCVMLVQSLSLFRVVVLAEFVTLVARLCTIIGIVYACKRQSGGSVPYGAEAEVGNGLRTLWEARMALAFGQLAYALTHVVFYVLAVSGLPVARWLGSSKELQHVRSVALGGQTTTQQQQQQQPRATWRTAFAFPFCFYSVEDSVRACRAHATLLRTFLGESLLRLVLSEGESFALTSLGSETARGYYQLIYSLGSLVARLLFRVWENACFVKWSREASLGHRDAAVALLKLMLRLSFYTGFSFTLLGPPLTHTFLATMYTSRWATPQVSTALRLYFYGLPLMAWNGLLEAFLRAVASPAVLHRLQRCMVFETVVYIGACYVTLAAFGNADTQGDSVSVLVLLNVFNMLWRCGASVYLLVTSPAPGAEEAAPPATSPAPVVRFADFASLFPPRIAVAFLSLFVCSRAMRTTSLVAVAVTGVAYAAAILAWDAEMRGLLVTQVWVRLAPLLLRRRQAKVTAA